MLELIRGDSRTISATVYTDSTHATPQSLATASAMRFTARQQGAARTLAFQKTLAAGGITVVNASLGTLTIAVLPADTSALPSQDMVLDYDLEITWTGGTVATVTRDIMSVLVDVSY